MTYGLRDSSVTAPLFGKASVRLESPSPLEAEVIDLFNDLRSSVLRYVLSFGLSSADAEEVVQDVFLALFQHLKNGKPRTNLKGWVFRVGHNLALKQRARNGRRDRLELPEISPDTHLHPQMNPEEQFSEGQRRRRLISTVETFSEVDRCCLYLRAEGLRYREIAGVLDISLGGVALSLGRSISRLTEVDRH